MVEDLSFENLKPKSLYTFSSLTFDRIPDFFAFARESVFRRHWFNRAMDLAQGKSSNSTVRLCLENDQIIGASDLIKPTNDTLLVFHVEVIPSKRGQYVGTALEGDAARVALNRGYKILRTQIDYNRPGAADLAQTIADYAGVTISRKGELVFKDESLVKLASLPESPDDIQDALNG